MGLLLGVSILQVPNLLLQFFRNLKEFYLKRLGLPLNNSPNSMNTETDNDRPKSILSLGQSNTTFKMINEQQVPIFRIENDVTKFVDDILDTLE